MALLAPNRAEYFLVSRFYGISKYMTEFWYINTFSNI